MAFRLMTDHVLLGRASGQDVACRSFSVGIIALQHILPVKRGASGPCRALRTAEFVATNHLIE